MRAFNVLLESFPLHQQQFPTDYVDIVFNHFSMNVVVDGNLVNVAKKWIPEVMHNTPRRHAYRSSENAFRHQSDVSFQHSCKTSYDFSSQNLVNAQQLTLKKQSEYYFSAGNLSKDLFLRSKMDEQGWVPVSLIATFNRDQARNMQGMMVTKMTAEVATMELLSNALLTLPTLEKC